MNMDMRISGSGSIPSGEYENISVSGSGRLSGAVRCSSFSSSGSSKGESIECSGDFKVSGSTSFSGCVKAENVGISGSFSCGGELIAEKGISCSGSAKCDDNVKCDNLSASGSFRARGGIEAEEVKISGVINCEGLLNAENIEIGFREDMNIGSIGGSRILIVSQTSKGIYKSLPFLRTLAKKSHGSVAVSSSIEGDNITLEYVNCPRVTGRVVAVGKGCNIDLVQYSEAIEISPNAKVLRTEKL